MVCKYATKKKKKKKSLETSHGLELFPKENG
jgi:hypothetical protein